jgi:hypothetical protein
MTHGELVILVGLALAAWGHTLVHELRPATATWTRLDELFPPAWRTPPSLAGACLLVVGALCVLIGAVG